MMEKIKFSEWEKLDLKIGTILEAKDHPNADKLYVLKIDLGNEERTVVAGIRKAYTHKQLIGKKVVIFTNLEPAMLREIKSEGMVLAAVKDDKVVLLTTEDEIENGAKIR